jgi:hypothetical protein
MVALTIGCGGAKSNHADMVVRCELKEDLTLGVSGHGAPNAPNRDKPS